jgi:uncharacterized Zn finger protein (UPF0148 family)
MYLSNRGTRRNCARCGEPCPQFRAHTGQFCPLCVIATTDNPGRVVKAKQTLAEQDARARVSLAHPVTKVEPAEEHRRQEAARVQRAPKEEAPPPARSVGNVLVW